MGGAFAMMLGGAAVNSVAFSLSNYAFSKLRKSHSDEEQKRHDRAIEELQAAQARWARKRAARLDWLNEQLRRENAAVKTYKDVDEAGRLYFQITGKTAPDSAGPEPQLSDFYTPSDEQQSYEIGLVLAGMGISSLVAYKVLH